MAKIKFYAVRKGLIPGVYDTWDECKSQVDGFSGAEYKSFGTFEEAEAYIKKESNCELNLANKDLIAYVDGSYNNKTKEYSFGVVLICDNTVVETISRKGTSEDAATMRNVAGEIGGACAAIKFAAEKRAKTLVIYYDYEGIGKWADRKWKTNNKYTKAYADIVAKARKCFKIKFIKVKSHSGDKYNDYADKLAKKALGF